MVSFSIYFLESFLDFLIFKNQLKINHQNNNKWSVSITFGYFLMLKGLKRIDNNCKFRAIYDSEYMIQKDTKMMIIIVQKRIKEFVKNSHIIICLLCLISDLFLSTIRPILMWPSQPIAVSALSQLQKEKIIKQIKLE